MKVSVIGLGRMGQAISARLLDAGSTVTVWNRSPGRVDDLVKRGAREAASVADAVERGDIVVTSLSNDQAVRDVVTGAGGIAASIGDRLYVDCTTTTPELSAELSETFPAFVAMPVLGSPDAVRSGAAICLVGGTSEAVARAKGLAGLISGQHHAYGSAPLASTAKLASNLMLLTSLVGMAESVAVGRAGGLSDAELRALFAGSPLLGPGMKNRVDAIVDGQGPTWWTVKLGVKDANAALDVAKAAGLDLPAAVEAAARYELVGNRGLEDRDIASVAVLYPSESDPHPAPAASAPRTESSNSASNAPTDG